MTNKWPPNQKLRRERELRGWSQADVATRIGSDPKNVGRWERGEGLPGPYYRQKLVELFGKNAEELGLIEDAPTRNLLTSSQTEQVIGAIDATKLTHRAWWQDDWGEAPHIEKFYGRETELAKIEQWIVGDHCRMVPILGIGGVGKTAFATMVVKNIIDTNDTFENVFWRSLQN